jgi:hypothetical protein
VSHCGLAIYIKKYVNAKYKIIGNSNISPCKKNIIFRKSSKKETQILQDIIITL